MMIEAEFLVVGSGPAGVSTAFPLVEAGHNLVMLDGVGPKATPWAKPLDARAPWRRMLGEKLEAVASDEAQSPKLGTPYARQITCSFSRESTIASSNFLAIGAIARGGLSSIWGGLVSEFDKSDLNGWPVSATDLQPYYREIVDRIGVSGQLDDLSDFYGRSGKLDFPPSIGPTAKHVYEKYRAQPKRKDFQLGLARNALITRDRAGRQACNLSQNCLWGCERGAIYDSRFDLASLSRYGNFRLLEDAFAVNLRKVGSSWELVLRDGRRIRATKVILAAGCLSTTKLAVAAMPGPPERLRLLNNPVLAMPFLVPRFLGTGAPERGYSLAQLGYRHAYGAGLEDYVSGGVYEISALPSWNFTSRLPFSRRAGMTLFPLVAPALLIATCYFSGSLSDNSLTWTKSEDQVSLSISGSSSPQLPTIVDKVKQGLGRAFRNIGALLLPGTTLAAPGTDVHYGGTLPMGSSAGTSVTGQLAGADGIFIVDGSGFCSMPAKYPTLTIMANAARIGHHLASSS